MTDKQEKHKRRVRYKGTHPRKYSDKYKELNPNKYPDEVEKSMYDLLTDSAVTAEVDG